MRPNTYNAHETARTHALHGRELASFAARATAFAIDFVIAGALFMLLVYPAALLLVRTGVVEVHGDVKLQLNFFHNWYSVVWLVLYFSLTTYFGGGRTPGKRLMRIRAVSTAHEHLSLWHSTERALGYGASALEFGFGFAQYFVNRNRRTVHDRIAETIVVSDRPRKPAPDADSAPGAGDHAA